MLDFARKPTPERFVVFDADFGARLPGVPEISFH